MKKHFGAGILLVLLLLSTVSCSWLPVPASKKIPLTGPAYKKVVLPPKPAQIPESTLYTGNGNSSLRIENPSDNSVFYITGNTADRFFLVEGYDVNKEYTEQFVCTTREYSGLLLDSRGPTVAFKVEATGDWSIEVRSIYTCRTVAAGETVTGTGDDVLLIEGDSKSATVMAVDLGEPCHFAVKTYGTTCDLPVNEGHPYQGTVPLVDNPDILVITAGGDWSVTIE